MALYWLTQFLRSHRLFPPWKSGKTYCIPSIFIILRERDGFFKIFQFLYIPNLQFFFLYTKFGTSCYEHPIFFWCKPVESTLDVPMTFYYSYGNRAYVTSRALRRFLGIQDVCEYRCDRGRTRVYFSKYLPIHHFSSPSDFEASSRIHGIPLFPAGPT